jgi:hypothetical protein
MGMLLALALPCCMRVCCRAVLLLLLLLLLCGGYCALFARLCVSAVLLCSAFSLAHLTLQSLNTQQQTWQRALISARVSGIAHAPCCAPLCAPCELKGRALSLCSAMQRPGARWKSRRSCVPLLPFVCVSEGKCFRQNCKYSHAGAGGAPAPYGGGYGPSPHLRRLLPAPRAVACFAVVAWSSARFSSLCLFLLLFR